MPVSQRSRPSTRPLGPVDRIPTQPQPSCLGAAHREEAAFSVDEGGRVGGSRLAELEAVRSCSFRLYLVQRPVGFISPLCST